MDWTKLFGAGAGGGGGGGGKTTSATSGVSLNSSYGSSDLTQYVPWIIGGVALVLVVAIVFVFTGKK